MSEYDPSSFDALLAEQEVVQAQKFQGRLLDEYSRYIFPAQDWKEPRSSAVTDFMRPLCQSDKVTLEGVLVGLSDTLGRPAHWVDMGGGRGLAMRQFAGNVGRRALRLTNVDLFDYGLEGLGSEYIQYLQGLPGELTDEKTKPHFVRANAETVSLDEPADIITSVEGMQYLNDPLAAMCNWYNQLNDDGLLIISAERDWSSWIRYQRKPGRGDRIETPTRHLLKAFDEAGIAYAASDECDWANGHRPILDPSCFSNLVVQKKVGTELTVNSKIDHVWVNPWDFKAAYYDEQPDSALIAVAAQG